MYPRGGTLTGRVPCHCRSEGHRHLSTHYPDLHGRLFPSATTPTTTPEWSIKTRSARPPMRTQPRTAPETRATTPPGVEVARLTAWATDNPTFPIKKGNAYARLLAAPARMFVPTGLKRPSSLSSTSTP